jgi:hypothetical protein
MRISKFTLVAFVFAGSLTVPALATANAPPKISGTPPATTINQPTYYVFQPTATDADGNRLKFGIKNMPAWGTFDSRNGLFRGWISSWYAGREFSNIVISVSDGRRTTSLPAFSIKYVKPSGKPGDPGGSSGSNTAPTIAGAPAQTVALGQSFAFRPTAADAQNNALAFSITNKPAWASFSTSTGQLAGTPTAAGSYGPIIISVSDGKASTALPAFSIAVQGAKIVPGSGGSQPPLGAALVTWTPPTQNVDGSAVTNLAGYRILYGTAAGKYTQTVEVKNAGLTSMMVENLTPATYYFGVKAFTTDGVESELSNSASKVVN